MSKIYNEYLKIKEKDNNKLYLFKCGKFYIFIADDCNLINEYVVLKKVKFSNNIYKCGFPKESLNDYLRVFKNHKLNIEIIEEINNNIEDYIKSIDINNLTPLEALDKIKILKELIK